MRFTSTRAVLRLGFTALCFAAAGCGDGDRSDDEARIAKAVELAATSEKISATCETAVTKRFVREVYGGLNACREANSDDDDEDQDSHDTATVSETRIDGRRATTELKLVSDGEPITGRVALVEVGDDWKLDRFGATFLRSLFAGLPKLGNAPPTSAACFARASRGLSDRERRQAAMALLGDRFEDVATSILKCVFAAIDVRKTFDDTIAKELRKDGESKARIACVKRGLQTALSEDDLVRIAIREAKSPDADLPADVKEKLPRVFQAC